MHLHYDESSKGLMATVLWFYTQMQVDTSKGLSTTAMLDKELLASRHIDTVNVDCIESLAFVLTVNEFCRFSAETKIDQLPVQRRPTEASELWSRGEQVYPRRSLLPHEDTPARTSLLLSWCLQSEDQTTITFFAFSQQLPPAK